MKVNAYLLAADPAWVEECVASLYPVVDRIVVSYDASATSWTGTPLPVDETLRRLKEADPDGKAELAPGHYWRPDHSPMANETHQRREALALAGRDADWVLQLDSDEILTAPELFLDCVAEAERRGFSGVEYPARNLYQYLGGSRYLEHGRRGQRIASHYPGPVAVRSGVQLDVARQGPRDLFRIDVGARNHDPGHPRGTAVHRVVPHDAAIQHFSWVRSVQQMYEKTRSWGHAHERDWRPRIEAWEASRRRPHLAVLRSERRPSLTGGHTLRFTTLTDAPDAEALRRNGIEP